MGWFDEQGITGFVPVQQPQGRPGAELGPPPQAPQGPPPGMPPQGRQPFNLDAFQARAKELSQGLKGTNAEFRQVLFPQLAQEFEGIERFGSKGDKIRLPGGGVIDAVLSAGLGGKGFQFGLEGPAAPKAPPQMAQSMASYGDMIQFRPQMPGGDVPPPAGMDAGVSAPPPTTRQRPPAWDGGPERIAGPQAMAAYNQTPMGQAPPMYVPQTVKGPAPMPIPGFANGVQNFSGGPALVGEQGPELLNLPKGSDVIPLGGGMPKVGNTGQTPGWADGAALGMAGAGGGFPKLGGGGVSQESPMLGDMMKFGTPAGGAAGLPGGPPLPGVLGGGGGPNLGGADRPMQGQTPGWGDGALGALAQKPAMPGVPSLDGSGNGGPMFDQKIGGVVNSFAGGGGAAPAIGSAGGPMTLGGGPGSALPQVAPGGGPINLGNGGGTPAIGGGGPNPGGAITLGNGGALPRIGQANPANGGGQPAPGAPGAFNAPSPYTPQATGGPQAWTGQPMTAAQAQAGSAVNAQQVNPAAAVQAERISAPGSIQADQIRGPEAIQAERLNAQQFRGTTAADMQADPGYQFRESRTLAALQNAAAAKGNLRNTNTFQALMDTGGQMASQEFANTDARRFRNHSDTNANALNFGQANNANRFQAYDLTNRYQQQAALANQQANLQAGTTNANFNFAAQQANAANALQAGTFNAGQQNQMGQFNASNAQQAQQFNSGQQQQNAQFNASSQNQVGQANQANSLAAWQAQAGLNQNNSQFNAGRSDAANQNNFANSLAAWQANTGADINRGQLALGNRQADQSYALGNRQADNSYDLGRRGIDQGYYQTDKNYDLGMTNAANTRALGQGNIDLGRYQADQSYDLGRRNNDLGWYGAQNSAANAAGSLGLGWANYGLNSSGQDFNQRFAVTQLGYDAARNAGGYAGDYGAASGGYATGAGNAGAAGAVGAANAWNQGIGGAVNAGIGAYGAYQGGKK